MFHNFIGNDKLHQLTSQEPQHLRIDLSDFNNQNRYAKFSHFGVADAIDFFRASIGGYSGNAGGYRAYTIGPTCDDVIGNKHAFIKLKIYSVRCMQRSAGKCISRNRRLAVFE